MNVYDFDKTIFYPDSSFKFIKFALKKNPRIVFKIIPKLINAQGTAEIKEAFFYTIRYIPDIDALVDEFWDKHFDRILPWYLKRRKSDDVIVSASPEFLIKVAACRLGVRFIATPMNKYSGKIMGMNCHDIEKVRRFKAEYPDQKIENFYSDSLSDAPMAELAERAFIVNKGKVKDWPK